MRLEDILAHVWATSSQTNPKGKNGPSELASFLRKAQHGEVPLYLSAGDYFVYAIIVPARSPTTEDVDDVLDWSLTVPGGYGWGYSFEDGEPRLRTFDPLDAGSTRTEMLDGGFAPVFVRGFEGRGKSYVEPNQVLTHVLSVHRVDEKEAWCEQNELGELVPRIRTKQEDRTFACTVDRDALDRFLTITRTMVVRVVDVARRPPQPFEQSRAGRFVGQKVHGVYLRTWVNAAGEFTGARGFDCFGPSPRARTAIAKALVDGQPRRYAKFIINDWRNKRTVEWSADPKKLGNYFVPSKLPFETSPAFFKPDVLAYYRSDPSRFVVDHDEVQCIGAWSLRYDINKEGQVHAYIVDLSKLPYEEQLRWKASNEKPKAEISASAYRRDFLGEWTRDYNPLDSFREIAENFPALNGAETIWKLGSLAPTRDLSTLGFVLTESRKELDDQMLNLSQVFVEGFHAPTINALAKRLGCWEKTLGSLKQLERVMEKLSIDQETRRKILEPGFSIQGYRKSVAHRGSRGHSKATGDQRTYFRELLGACDASMRLLAELVKAGTFSEGAR